MIKLKCTKCLITKKFDKFSFRKDKGSRRKQCKECCKKRSLQYATSNKESMQRTQRAYYKKNKKNIIKRSLKWQKINSKRKQEINKKWLHAVPSRKQALHLKKKFGISVEEYDRMKMEQGGVCAICNETERIIESRTNKVRNLAVDHDHVSGKIRGLLCYRCNTTLGKFNDDLSLFRAAIEYLLKNNRKVT